jgi:hypothetical protein
VKKRFGDEYNGAALGDARRSARLAELGTALAVLPAASFPAALGDGAALEAAYRFLGNEAVTPDAVLGPHIRETVTRCRSHSEVIVAHDTTDFVFPGDKRRGLGRMRGTLERGFFAHPALAVSLDGRREPLGVLHMETWTRAPAAKASRKKTPRERQQDGDRESLRWGRGVQAVEEVLPSGMAIHVMDREADDYALLASMVGAGRRFILRATFDRRVAEADSVTEALTLKPVVVEREVPLSERKQPPFAKNAKIHPARTARVATLGIKAGRVTLLRPRDLVGALPTELALNVVIVEELNPPAGEPPVVWRLYTTEPVATPTDLEHIVDGYRCRWRIEEFFKAIKTGCAIERRQLEHGHSLMNALAVYVPIAWRVLRLRTLAQTDANSPASAVLSAIHIRLLRRLPRTALPRSPTVADALVAVAALGGHLKRNGPPGWITLARGYERLLTLEEGALLAAKM